MTIEQAAKTMRCEVGARYGVGRRETAGAATELFVASTSETLTYPLRALKPSHLLGQKYMLGVKDGRLRTFTPSTTGAREWAPMMRLLRA